MTRCCAPAPPAGSLSGAIALIFRGTCDFIVKVTYAQSAGAVGVVFIDNNSPAVTGWGGLGSATIPAFMISQSDGQNLQTFVDANPGTMATHESGFPAGARQHAGIDSRCHRGLRFARPSRSATTD